MYRTTKRITKAGIVLLIFIALAIFAYANSVNSEGGVITRSDVSLTTSTDTWQGYFGYIDLVQLGYNAPMKVMNTTNQSNTITFTDGLTPSTHIGYLFVISGKSEPTVNVQNLVAGNLAELDALIGPGYDDSSNLFK